MQRYKAWRYKCDHCGKTGASGGHMRHHEKRCARNPHRDCGMCRPFGEPKTDTDVASAVAALGKGDEEGVENLRHHVDGCPMCMLAAIVQSGLQTADEWDGKHVIRGFRVPFDFKEEKADWFEYHNMDESYYR